MRRAIKQQKLDELVLKFARVVGGKAVWKSWILGMRTQMREVAPPRQSWDTLPLVDKALDEGIAFHVVHEFLRWCQLQGIEAEDIISKYG